MKKFILSLIKFILPFLFFGLISLVYYHLYNIVFNKEFQEISENEILIMGDSQAQRIKQNISNKKTVNIASSAEHFYFTYKKLKKLTNNKNSFKINTVILNVGPHSFGPLFNTIFDINSMAGKNTLKTKLYYLDLMNDFEFIKKVENLFSYDFINGIFSKPKIFGFKSSSASKPNYKIIKKAINDHFIENQNKYKFSFSQREYLYKIDSLCNVNNIKLILLSAPYHQQFKKEIPKIYIDFFYDSISVLNKNIHFNFIDDEIDSILMSDGTHLNEIGAEKYSKIISNYLIAFGISSSSSSAISKPLK